MNKFCKSRSSKFIIPSSNNNKLTLQHNSDVVKLQNNYEIEIVKTDYNVTQNITVKNDESKPVDVIYTPKMEIPFELNPTKQLNKDKVVTYGDSLDYLYKKNKNKNNTLL